MRDADFARLYERVDVLEKRMDAWFEALASGAPQPAPAASGDEELRLLRELEAVVRDHTECRCETMERALGGLDAARRNDRAR